MDPSSHSPWSTLVQSLLSIVGSFAGILIFFFLFSYLSNVFARVSRLKRKCYVSILSDADGEKKALGRSAPVILQMNLTGLIGADLLNLESIETQLSEANIGELSGKRVRGIFLNIDSPGGSAKDSDAIYRRIKAFKEKNTIPVYAFVDGMCASGGFLAACSADKIYASPSSVIGSVGVRIMTPFFNLTKVLERWDVGVRTYAEGKNKDHLNPFRPWEEGEDSDLKAILSYFYNRFVDLVVKERKMEKDQLVNEYGAKVFSAEDAAKFKFIDEVGDFEKALSDLAQTSGIEKETPYQVVELVKKKAWFKELMEKSPLITGNIQHHFTNQKLQSTIAYLFFT